MIKRFLTDSLLNIIGNTFLMIIIQFLLFPLLGDKNNADNFGQIITLYAVTTFIAVVVGSTLNNVRLLNYTRESIGIYLVDLKELIKYSLLLSSLIFSIVFIVFEIPLMDIIILLLLSIIWTYKNYFIVTFRMHLDYKQIFFVYIIQSFVLLILIPTIYINVFWGFIFLLSEIVTLIYIGYVFYKKQYKFINTTFNRKQRKEYHNLISISIINNSITYLDRFLIYPLLGGTAVTILFLSTFVGKIFASLSSPINGVILSYISGDISLNAKKIFTTSVIISFVSGLVILIICFPSSLLIIKYLYPSFSNINYNYIFLGNLGVILSIIGNIIFPLNLKFTTVKVQACIQYFYFTFFLLSTLILTLYFSLYGFLFSVIVSNMVRYLLLTLSGYYFIFRKGES